MRRTHIMAYFLSVVVLVSTAPCVASAASMIIKPHQFKPCNPTDSHNYQWPVHIRGDGGDAEYYTVVNLPVGRRVTELVLFYEGDGSGFAQVHLYRNKIASLSETMGYVGSGVNTSGEIEAFRDTNIDSPLVKTGYTYWVNLQVSEDDIVYGVNVKYE